MVFCNELSENEIIEKYMPGGFIYDDTVHMPLSSPDIMKAIRNFRFRSNDIVISSYPKSGTTWTSEIVSWLAHANNSNISITANLKDRVQFLEIINLETRVPYFQTLEQMPENEQRLIKTHLPPHLLHSSIWESKAKIVHAYRNPLDALVSFYNFYKSIPILEYKKSWNEFFETYKKGYVCYGNHCKHLKLWCEHRGASNLLLVEYESMQQDVKHEIRRIAQFIAVDNITDELIEQIAQKCSFGSMKNNPLIWAPLVRKGIVGDWKNYFSEEQKEYILKSFEENVAPFGIKSKYE